LLDGIIFRNVTERYLVNSDRTPGGAQTRSKQHGVFGGPPFPQTVRAARGARVWAGSEDDDKPYLDWMSALASVGLGYCNKYVDEAVMRQISTGTALPLPSQLEYEVADLLCDTLKWPQQVRFVKTGSEATAAAMQIARAHTKRRKVVSIGYHGWHEAHLPSENLVDVPWGSWAVEEDVDCRTAAVLLEPMRDSEPEEGYIEAVQYACQRTGALFILDEMVTGFRWAIGGASEYFGIIPDLACYGKAMANGYALACVVGPRKLMKHAHDVSSTFGGEGVGLAAAKATIEIYKQGDVIPRLWGVGKQLLAGCPALTGYAVHPHFKESEGWTESEQVIPVVQACAKEGVLIHPSGMNPMFAHSDADVTRTIAVLNKALGGSSTQSPV
jgi:glutamate-1-semialdehyde aminotransferase